MQVVATDESASDASESAALLRLRNLHKAFGETVALDDVSLSVQRGTVHTILGENGSGKSTLVKTLSGVLSPDRGVVEINGERLPKATPKAARGAGIATVFQEVLVAPNRSVTENALLGQDSFTRWKIRGPARQRLVLDTLAELSHSTFDPDEEVGNLTLVQQHQVAIARAFLLDPKVLVLDESTAALDISERDLLFAAVRKRVEQGMAVVFVSHRMDEVLNLSDQVTVLRSGRRIETLSKQELDERRLLALLNPEAVA